MPPAIPLTTPRTTTARPLFFWSICFPEEPAPLHSLTNEPPDYMLVYVDSPKATRAARTDGGGPGGVHMLVHEQWDVLRELYVPHDGRPHRVEGEYRRNGQAGTIGRRFLIEADLIVERDPDEWPEAERSPAQARPPAGLDPAVAIVDRTMSHVEITDERMSSMARETARRGVLAGEMVAGEARASAAFVVDFMREQQRLEVERQRADADRLAAFSDRAFRLGEQAMQSAERIAIARTRADATAEAPAPVGGLGLGGTLGQVAQLAQLAAPAAAWAVEKLGGFDGIKQKAVALLGGGGAGGGGRGLEMLAAAGTRLIEAVETVAMAKHAAAIPPEPAQPETIPEEAA